MPVGPVKIDWSNPILNGLSFLKVFNTSEFTPDFADNGSVVFTGRNSSVVRTISGGTALTTNMWDANNLAEQHLDVAH